MTVQRGREERVDVLIVTAVKDEWDAVLAIDTGATPGSSWETPPGVAGPEVFYRDFTTDGGTLRMGAVQAFGMGREQAVIAAAPLLERHPEIRCLAMCGVCAGRRGDVALGDVIIADRTWPYDAGKLKTTIDEQGHRIERFQGDMDLYRIHPAEWKHRAERFQIDPATSWIKERPRSYDEQGDWVLERLAKNEDPKVHADRKVRCPDWGKVLAQLWKAKRLDEGELKLTDAGRNHILRRLMLEPDGLREPEPFKTIVGPIASGAPVAQDPTIFERLSDSQAMRKVVGLEMETSAILGLAYLRKVPYAVVMKGVMDHADASKSDNMKPFAAKASAECLITFLRQNLPSDTPASAPAVAMVTLLAVLRVLKVTRAAFESQIRLRDQLVRQISERLVLDPYEKGEYEAFFLRHFASMDAEEKRLFREIRGLTETLYEHNAKALKLLNESPDPISTLEGLGTLRNHLELWVRKYEHSFVTTPEMCLVYLGPEERAPFPSEVERELYRLLSERRCPGLVAADAPPKMGEHFGTDSDWHMAQEKRWRLKRLTELEAQASSASPVVRKDVEVEMAKIFRRALYPGVDWEVLAGPGGLDKLYASLHALSPEPRWPLDLLVAKASAEAALSEAGDWARVRALLPALPVIAFHAETLPLDTELPALWRDLRARLRQWTAQS